MKISANTKQLLNAIQHVSAATAARTTIPMLTNVKLTAEATGRLTVMATDQDVGIRHTVEGQDVTEAGSCCLPPSTIQQILRETDSETVSITTSDRDVTVKTDNATFKLPYIDPEAFPGVTAPESFENYHEVEAGRLARLLDRVAFATDRMERTRWAVTGVQWKVGKETIRLAGTNTKHLAAATGKAIVHGETTKGEHLIPNRTVKLLAKYLAGDKAAPVQVSLDANKATFRGADWLVVTKLIEGKFPPIDDIIPKKAGNKLSVSREPFAKAIRQASVTVDDTTQRVDMAFTKGKVTMKGTGAETGQSTVTMKLPDSELEIDVAMDPAFLGQFLSAFDDEETLLLEITSGEKPVVFRTPDGSGLYLIMPICG